MDYTTEFETFWVKYPKRWNRDLGCFVKRKKWPAFQKWQKLSKAIRSDCLAKVHLIRRAEGTPRDCVTWLNQRGWEDIELEKPKLIPTKLLPKMKIVESIEVNINNERNRQIAALKGQSKV